MFPFFYRKKRLFRIKTPWKHLKLLLILGLLYAILTTEIWVLIPLVIFVAILYFLVRVFSSPKGKKGERIVNRQARKLLDNNKYQLLENVTLPTVGGTTQIDQLIISIYGVFVVETKNMTGWIFGSPKQRIWTQII